ncbi:MAG TPA: T9SS type A sorting domain-containing protein [Chitinophagales bacterium]|nr:T9SS type A sorting domain-containing protein [Chitinophagales bacterium]
MKKKILQILPAALLITGVMQTGHAQIVSGVSFLKGKWIELAVSDCGTYASGGAGMIVAAPATYHENTIDGSLSFGNDVTADGWDIGVPDQCGDFIMPGSPEEGFAIQIGAGPVYGNLQPYCYRFGAFVAAAPDFVGTNLTNVNGGSIRKTLWQGTNTGIGLAVSQTTYWLNSKQSYITIVDLCNGGDDMYDVYYARNADPDNDQLTNGTFNTNNNAKKQYATAGYSQVTATSTVGSPCYMAYVSNDSRAKVSRGNFSMGSPSDIWNGLSGYIQTPGAVNADAAIQISFKIDTLLHNDCGCFTYSTMLTSAGLTDQLALTGTACATLGTLARYGEDMIDGYLNDPTNFLKNEMVVYPSPSNGNFTVNIFEMEHANITVVNAVGQVVYQVNDVSKIAGITLDNPVPGMYFVNAEYGEGKKITRSLVIE